MLSMRGVRGSALAVLLFAGAFASSACDVEGAEEEELRQRIEQSQHLSTLRACTCQEVTNPPQPFVGWPTFDLCVTGNDSAVNTIRSRRSDGLPVDIRWLDPKTAPGFVELYWFVEAGGTGLHYFESFCDDPADDDPACGWQPEEFPSMAVTEADITGKDCSGDPMTGKGLIISWGNRSVTLPSYPQ